MIIFIPGEYLENRYSSFLNSDIETYLQRYSLKYIKIPALPSPPPPPEMFLNATASIKTKMHQLKEITALYEEGLIDNDTQFFFHDIWFPGIESLAYMNYFYKIKPKITGIIHAGSFTDTDFVRDMERWAKHFEEIVFDISTEIYCTSNFIKNDILKKRIVQPEKLVAAGFPIDSKLIGYLNAPNVPKENRVVFNARLADEKQPWLFDQLKERYKNTGWEFFSTHEHKLSRHDYYTLLASSKVVVSFALQENFGLAIAEAVYLGCIPLLPNRLVYPELYDRKYLYNSFEECSQLLGGIIDKTLTLPVPQLKLNNPYPLWFKN